MKTKKGFSLVELVIVIAVIAILAGILIPTFSNIISMTRLSADKQLVRSLNQIIVSGDKPGTASEMISKILNDNYTQKDLSIKSDCFMVWDSELNTIALVDNDNNVVYCLNDDFKQKLTIDSFNSSMWKLTDTIPDTNYYNIALLDGFNQQTVNSKVGIDTLTNDKITNIVIEDAISNIMVVTSDFSQKITIKNSTVTHKGKCGKITIDNSTISEYGVVACYLAKSGNISNHNTIYCLQNIDATISGVQNIFNHEISPCSEHNNIIFENSFLSGYMICLDCGTCVKVDSIINNGCHHNIVIEHGVLPDCTHDGYTDKVYCKICNSVFAEKNILSATGHNTIIDKGYNADCTHNGLSDGSHCSTCGATLIAQSILPALGHDITNIEYLAPTCTKYGHSAYNECSRCGHTENKVIYEPTGHTPVTDNSIAPDCYHTGLTEGSHCSVCGEILTPQSVIPFSHNFENGICSICNTQDPNRTIDMTTLLNKVCPDKTKLLEMYFGNSASYTEIINNTPGENIINVSISSVGNINAYINYSEDNYIIYILSDNIMFFSSSCCNAFSGATNMRVLQFDYISTKYVVTMQNMFYGDEMLYTLDLSMFDTKRVTDMSYMFRDCHNLTTLNLNNFRTIMVNNMSGMFNQCKRLVNFDLSGFMTSEVLYMDTMFLGCEAIEDLTLDFNTTKVITMRGMFAYCEGLITLDITSFDTRSLVDSSIMFVCNQKLEHIYSRDFDTTNITTSNDMFTDSTSLNGYNPLRTDISMAKVINGYFSQK